MLGLGRAVPLPDSASNQPSSSSEMLLNSKHIPGPDRPIIEFCKHYDLTENVQKKLMDNGYMHARMFRCILPPTSLTSGSVHAQCGCCRIDGFGGTCICVPGHGVGDVHGGCGCVCFGGCVCSGCIRVGGGGAYVSSGEACGDAGGWFDP